MLPWKPALAVHSGVHTIAGCCAMCTAANDKANSTVCRAWTLDSITNQCILSQSSNTAFPVNSSTAGYPLAADPASFCTEVRADTFDKGDVYDRHMLSDVACRFLPPTNDGSKFPLSWMDSSNRSRGTAWLFYPEEGGKCNCKPSAPVGNTTCIAPQWSLEVDAQRLVKGRPWAVYIHGGRFMYLNALQEGYAMLASRVAKAGGVGVLAVDYRTAHSGRGGAQYPGGLLDVIEGLRWLHRQGASSLYLYGDSSGATQVAELLLFNIRHNLGLRIAGAVFFSAWLDLSGSGPGYFSQSSCERSSSCHRPVMWPSKPMFDRRDGQCAAKEYLPNSTAITDSVASPMHALPSELAKLPPLLQVVGGNEVLLQENFEFAQRVSAAGGAVQLEVWEGMWHDFEEHTEGCKSGTRLPEAAEALEVAGNFLRTGALSGGCKTSGSGAGLACVHWHMKYNMLPPVLDSQCADDQ
eukprot:gnl/TRDRNA2_/TRDRNA2_125517_c0_seq1.p1 gnl/TRDRNA2_/TRDRNA2_125517_c0~~gnl/TRDRNA2_/TRDRNA2_125517_c0_seq1.p1  ORF type:complete len:466 (+),score=60.84 gnl/TRDRNA2_/TRDRNA2_125517_c0_seq1:86-1483(+)